MLNELTKEQRATMVAVREEWLERGLKPQQFNRAKFDIGIKWLYSLINLPMPMVIEVDSPLGGQYAVSLLKKMLNGHLKVGQVRDQVGAQVWDQVWDQVRGQVRDQVMAQVMDQVMAQVWDQVWDQVGDQVRDQVGAQVRDQVGAQVGAQVWDQVWDQGRMHCTDGPCIEWADSYKLYAIRGRILPSWIWEDKEKHTKKKYLAEKNAEHRAGMYAVLGQERTMKMLGAKKVDTCTDNDETITLYKTNEEFDTADGRQPYAWVQCNCPSTGTTYMLGVKPHHTKAKAAMAELWGLDEKEYIIEQHT